VSVCPSVCLSPRRTAALGYRHAGCLQLSHVRTRPRTDVDPPWVELPSAGGISSHRRPGRQLVKHSPTAVKSSIAPLPGQLPYDVSWNSSVPSKWYRHISSTQRSLSFASIKSLMCMIATQSAVGFNLAVLSWWPQTWSTRGFPWTCKTRGILREFCATSGKNCNKQSSFSSSFKYLCKTAVDWVVNRITTISWISDIVRVRWWPVVLLELMWSDPRWRSLLHLLRNNLWNSKFMALEKPGKLGEFFLLLVATLTLPAD